MRALSPLIPAASLVLALSACSESPATRICDPGEQQLCPCADGREALQECSDDGSRWQECACWDLPDATDDVTPDTSMDAGDDAADADDDGSADTTEDAVDAGDDAPFDVDDVSGDADDVEEDTATDIVDDAKLDAADVATDTATLPDAPSGTYEIATVHGVQSSETSLRCDPAAGVQRLAYVLVDGVVQDSPVFDHPSGHRAFFVYEPPGGEYREVLVLLEPGADEFSRGDRVNLEAEWREVDCETRLYALAVEWAGDGTDRDRPYVDASPSELSASGDASRYEALEGVLTSVRPDEPPYRYTVTAVDGPTVTVTPEGRDWPFVLRLDAVDAAYEVGATIPGDIRGFGMWDGTTFTLVPRSLEDL